MEIFWLILINFLLILINLMHPCKIKVAFNFFGEKNLTVPKCLNIINENVVIIYSLSDPFVFRQTRQKVIFKNTEWFFWGGGGGGGGGGGDFVHSMKINFPTDFHCAEKNCLIILQNRFFHVPQSKGSKTGLEQHEGE